MALPTRFLPLLIGLSLAGTVLPVAAAIPTLTTVQDLTGNNEDTATSITYQELKDAANEADVDGGTIDFVFKSSIAGTLRRNGNVVDPGDTLEAGQSWSWTPAADANGTINAFRVRALAGGEESATDVVVAIVVPAVNDAPSFTKGANVPVNEDSGAYSQAAWATAIDPGASNESGQTLTFTVTATNTALFSAQPAVDSTGRLTFTPAANANGTTAVTIRLSDNGGGSNQSAAQSFNISIAAQPDPPVLAGALRTGPISDAKINDVVPAYKIFEDLTITDPDHNAPNFDAQVVTVTIGAEAAAYGVISAPNFTPTEDTGVKIFTSNGSLSPSQAQAALRAITYTPLSNQFPVGLYPFSVKVDLRDSTPTAITPLTGTAQMQSVNDVPQVTASTSVATIPDNAESTPFRLSITDPDQGDTFSVIVTETTATPRGTVIMPVSPLTGTAAGVAAAIQGVRYVPLPQASNQTANFSVSVADVHPDQTSGTAVLRPISLTVAFVNNPPELAGITTNLIRTTDDPNVLPKVYPFSSVTVTDNDPGQILTLTLSLDDPAKGDFVGDFTTGFQMTGTAEAITTKLRAVMFQPEIDRIPVNQSETATMTISVTDQTAVRTNSQTRVEVTSVNGAPEVEWTLTSGGAFPTNALPALIDPAPAAKPFQAVRISDEGDVVVNVTLDDPLKGELKNPVGTPLATSFQEINPPSRTYRFTGTPAAAQLAIRALIFEPSTTYAFPANQPGRTNFTITASDAALNLTTKVLPIVLESDSRSFMVTSLVDDEALPGTLRHAISVARSNDVITFALPSYPATIRLTAANGPLVVDKHLSFYGPGQDKLTITGDSNSNGSAGPGDVQIFRITGGVRMKGLRLARGYAGIGGGISVGRSQPDEEAGSLVLEDCVISGCMASQWGGAVDIEGGSLKVDRCLFEGNSLNASSGLGGAAISLYTNEPCTILNSTFSGNSQAAPTGYGGGALYVENEVPSLLFPTTVTHCTFAGNLDAANKGSSIHSNVSNTRVTLANSIFADASARNLQVAGGGEILSNGGNLSTDNTTTTLIQGGVPQLATLLNKPTDKRNTDPRLAPLAEVEGPTRAYRLLPDSPAIGTGVAGLAAVDQRGVIRNTTVDMGAVDAQALGKLIVHEIFAPQATVQPHFIEFFNPRDQGAVNLNGYEIHINGVKRHAFTTPVVVNAGYGIILAANPALSPIAAHAGTLVITPSVAGVFDLGVRGTIELLAPTSAGLKVVESVSYVSVFANPVTPAASLDHDLESITLAPQFQGAAFVPHSLVGPPPNGGVFPGTGREVASPGMDSAKTPFGEPNAYPIASTDQMEITEDEIATLDVLANDLDADGSDEVLLVDLNPTISAIPPATSKATIQSPAGATVTMTPATAPLRGTSLTFDPRVAFKSLPEGARVTDTFAYTVLDYGGGEVAGYASGGVNLTTVSAPSHRLTAGMSVTIRDAGSYDGTYVVGTVTADTFDIPLAFTTNPAPLLRGRWRAAAARTPSALDEALVQVSVLGRNDPPTPAADIVATNEDTILRIFGDPALAGIGTALDTDGLYPAPRQFASIGMLANDSDPDTDDNPFSKLHVIGVCQASPTTGFTGTPGSSPVTVAAPAHGLETGATVLISGYGGHPSYNGFQVITVTGEDTFTVPVLYVDDHAQKGLWALLDNANRLSAVSQHGAEVTLEIRANRSQTNVVYNPRPSTHLNGLAIGESDTDRFYYAVEDTHGAVSLAQVVVNVAGANDTPLPEDNPASLVDLDPAVVGGLPLSQFLKDLDFLYLLPSSAGSGRVNAAIRPPGGEPDDVVIIADLDQTNEDTALPLASSYLLSNDSDVDRTNVLRVEIGAGQSLSREGAAITLSPDGSTVTYNPTSAPKLQALASKERIIDSFNITIFDGTARVVSLVAVVVEGRNDRPDANNLTLTTPEKTLLEVKPPGLLLSGVEIDQNGSLPDNRKFLLPVVDSATTVFGARVNVQLARRSGAIDGFAAVSGIPAATAILATAHGLQTGEDVVLPASGDLTGRYTVTKLDDNRFSIPVAYAGGFASLGGTWEVLASTFSYDPRNSVFSGPSGAPNFTLQGLAAGQEYNDTFTYTLLDGSFLFANDDIFRIEADRSAIELKVLANDTNLDGIATGRRIVAVGTPSAAGSVVLNGDQSLIYTPETGFVGDEVFTYTIEDSLGFRDTALVTARVTVDRLNGNLRANADHFTVAAGQAPLLNVLANDNIIPATGAPLTLDSIASTPNQSGEAVIENGRIRYTPDPSATIFPYTETFSYTMSGGGTTHATAAVTVLVVNRANTLNVRADSFGVAAGSVETTLDVLANDNILPSNGEALTIITTTPSLHGTVTILNGVALAYTPAPGFLGTDSFSYAAEDGSGGTGTALVTIRIGHVTTNSDIFSVRFDDPSKTEDNGFTALDVLANDHVIQGGGGALTVTGVTPGSVALGAMTIAPDGSALRFDPAVSATGQQDFTYTVTDGGGRSATATVTVVVVAGGIRASSDYFTVQTGSEATELAVLSNDIRIADVPGELAIAGIGTGINAPDQGGTVAISEDFKRIIYTAAPGFEGVESFTYTVTDGDSSDTARISVRSTAGELVAAEDAFLVFRGSTVNRLAVLSNDRIIPDAGQLLTITAIGMDPGNSGNPPHRGTLVIAEEGTALHYTPSADNDIYPYVETFTYDISAGGTSRAEGLIRIEVLDRVGVRNLETNHDVFTLRSDSIGTLLPVLANDSVLPAGTSGWTITSVTPPTANVCSPFLAGDFLQPAALSAKLAAQGSPLAQYLWGRITPASRTILANVATPESQLRITLVTEFNAIVQGAVLIHSAPRFSGITLREQTQALLDEGVTGEQLIVLNRLLLEDAYPAELRQAPGGGAAQINGNGIVYAPQPGFVGTERFTYRVSDGLGGTGFAEVIVRVGDVSVSDDAYTAIAGAGAVSLDVTANDGIYRTSFPAPPLPAQADFTLAPGKPITVDPVAAGAAVVDGSVVKFTPAAAFSGRATLTYWVHDDSGCLFSGKAIIAVLPPGNDRDSAVATIKVTGVNDPPELLNAVTSPVTDKTSVYPFANATVIEHDAQRQELVRITVTYPETHGTLTGSFTRLAPGVIELYGTAAEVTAALRAILFTPFSNRIPVGQTENNLFSVSMTDGVVPTPVVVNTGVVVVTPVNDSPIITGAVANQKVYQYSTLRPFAGMEITDIDNLGVQTQTVSVKIDTPSKGNLSNLAGFVQQPAGSGIYRLTGTPLVVSAALRGLVFEPTPGTRVFPEIPELVSFTVTSDDGFLVPPASDTNTSVLVMHGEVDKLLSLGGTGLDASQAAAAFGSGVAIHGDTMAVGSPMRDNPVVDTGRVHIYERNAGFGAPWGQVTEITGSDTATGDHFGQAVTIEGDVMVVGAPDARAGGANRTGAIYIFNRSTSDPLAWVQVARFASPVPNASGGDMFGSSVAIQGNMILAGAPLANVPGGARSGRVFAFRRGATPNSWTHVQTLIANDNRASGLAGDSEFFGLSVAFDGNTAIVGAPGANRGQGSAQWNYGAAYLFTRPNSDGTWTEAKRFDDFEKPAGATYSGFGYAVDMVGDRIVIGIHTVGTPFGTFRAGGVRIHERNAGGANQWGEVLQIAPNDGIPSANYATSLALSGDLMMIGSPGPSQDSPITRGYVELHRRSPAGVWSMIDRFTPGSSAATDRFGESVAIDGFTAVAGAPGDGVNGLNAAGAGSARVYQFQYNLGPRLTHPVADQIAVQGTPFSFTVDSFTFDDPVYPTGLTWGVQLEDGSPLPGAAWLSFNPATRTFSGTPVAGNNAAYRLVLHATNPLGTRILSNVFRIGLAAAPGTLAQAYQAWAAGQFTAGQLGNAGLEASVWGMNADSDRDGMKNVLEMLFGTDPEIWNPAQGVFQRNSSTIVSIAFPISTEFPQDSAKVEWSTNLSTWSRTGVVLTRNDLPGATDQMVAVVTSPTPRTKIYVRIVAE